MAHYRIASNRFQWNAILSFLVVVGSAVVGSALFVSLSSGAQHGWPHWVLAGVSVFVAIIAAIQKGSRLEKSAEEHRQAGARWNGILIELSELRAGSEEGVRTTQAIAEIGKKMEGIIDSSPSIPQAQFRRFGIGQAYECLGIQVPLISGPIPRAADRARLRLRRSKRRSAPATRPQG